MTGEGAICVDALPDDWKEATIAEHFDFKNGLNKAKQFFGYGTPIVNYMDVYRQPWLLPSHVTGKVSVTRGEQQAYSVKQYDAFFTRTSETVAEIGMCSVLMGPIESAVFSGFVLRARPSSDRLLPGFVAFAFRSRKVRQQIESSATYTTRALTNGRLLSAVSFALPPVHEQQHITAALKDIDDLIASVDVLIAKKRDIKQAAMQQLLTGKLRLPGFTGVWETVELGSLCSMKSGTGITSRSIFEDGPFPVYGANGLRGFTGSKTHNGVFPLIGRVGALCGNIQIARGDFFASEHAIVAEPRARTDPEWLALALTRLGLNRLSEASAQPVLTVGKLGVLRLLAPTDHLEQRAISRAILSMDDELKQLRSKMGKLRDIREGMTQQLLTGRIRLV